MTNDIRREVFLILADNPEISLTPSDDACKWDVCVERLDLFFGGSIRLHDWETILLRVKACKGALDATREATKQ